MLSDMFSNAFDQRQMFVAPMLKFNKATVANLEKLADYQFAALKTYLDMGFDYWKAAANITDPQDLPVFFRNQMETASAVQQKMLDDMRCLADMSIAIKTDFENITQENISQITPKGAMQAPDKAA